MMPTAVGIFRRVSCHLRPLQLGVETLQIRAVHLHHDLIDDPAAHPAQPVLQLPLVGEVVVVG